GLKVKTYYLQELKRMVRRLEEKTEIKGRATIENLQTEEVYSEKSADGSCSAWILLSCPESVLSRERMRLEEADRSQAKEIERLIAEGEGKLKSEELLPALSLFFLAFEMISESSAGDPLYWKLTERCRKVFNGIELEKVTAPVIVRTGMISDADLQVRFFYQKKPLPSIAVTFRFIDGHGEIDRRAETDSRGIARSALGKIYEPGRCRIEASFSLNGFLGKSFYEQELKRTVIFDMEAEGEKIPYTRTFSIEPLSNLTAQERYNWISQALAESLTFRLSQVPNVSIVKSPLDDVPYDYEIKGSFQVLGGEIEITIQAEDSSGDVTEAFQIKGPLESLLKLQEEITLELSDRLAFQISGTASNLPFTTSRQAFEAY
ncbi:MAG TPA: hypothetical protein VJC03_05815, partial [bacterium]|nr:hypothetical protein [bacterium]